MRANHSRTNGHRRRSTSHALRSAWLLMVLVAELAAWAPQTLASPAHVAPLTMLSDGGAVLPASCAGPGTESEPTIAASAGGRHLVAGWIQNGPPADVNLAAASRNRGRTWTTVALPGVTSCTGGEPDRSVDPSVSFGSDGTVYFGSLVNYRSTLGFFAYDVFASRSTDGGFGWSGPAAVDSLAGSPRADDAPFLVADPVRPRRAYMAWSRLPPDGTANQAIYFAHTSDRGRSWSPPLRVHDFPSGELANWPRLTVLPGGVLVMVFVEGTPGALSSGTGGTAVLAMRSEDGGRTWSPPVEVGQRSALDAVDPEGPQRIASRIPGLASGRDGRAYVVWSDSGPAGTGEILLSRSSNGGRSWSAPFNVSREGVQAFQPSVAVGRDGTVGVSWYDFHNDRPGDGALTTDAWFAHSHDHGVGWKQVHLAGPFDLRTAYEGGKPLGDHQGLAATPHGFAAAFIQAQPAAAHGPSDVFVGRIRLRQPRCAGKEASLTSTKRADAIPGTRVRDVIEALAGADVVHSLGGDDLVCGGRGRDLLVGGRGRDNLVGGKGKDSLKGGEGKDTLKGGGGHDRINCGAGIDLVVITGGDAIASSCERVVRR